MSDVATRLEEALSGRYRVIRQVGAGGMATVFLAHDIRHERDVAIKVLLPELAAAIGGERFLAEIKTTAKLQHPHILPLLDSGDADGLLFYVMPFIEGETLRTRLEKETQLPVDEAVRIAREALSALESAHKHGVVHRDIKPENILLHEGQALVADFGISLAVTAAAGPRLTQTGLSLGTPAYMSPEQAMGERAIGPRADIYAMGAVLYEMLVGEPPFTGPTVQAILARVMTEEARSVTIQRRSVPTHVEAAVLRALEKVPADRFSSAAEFSTALASSDFGTVTTSGSRRVAQKPAVSRFLRSPLTGWIVAAVLAIAAAAQLANARFRAPATAPIHLSVQLPPSMIMDLEKVYGIELSKDGSTLAVGVRVGGLAHLAVRRFASDSMALVPGSEGMRRGMAFSPDGKWIAFTVEGRLLKAPLAGGPPSFIANTSWSPLTWISDDALVYTADYDAGLRRISADGRDSVVLTNPDRKQSELGHWWPQILPDGDHVLFTNYISGNRSRIEVLSLSSGKRTVVAEAAYFGRYARGRLYFARGEAVMSAPFDHRTLKLSGNAQPVGVNILTNSANGWAGFAVAENGTFAYVRSESALLDYSWVDDRGNEESALDSGARASRAIASPNGRLMAIIRDGDIWTYERDRKLYTRLTRSDHNESAMIFSADSRYVIFQRDNPAWDLFRRAADASAPEELIVGSSRDKFANSTSPDGRTLLYNTDPGGGVGEEVMALRLDSGRSEAGEVIVSGPGNQETAVFSPDGHWIAYMSNESGRHEVFLSAFPRVPTSARVQLSVNGGESPAWSNDGRTVFFWWAGRIQRVAVNPSTGAIGRPQLLPQIDRMVHWTLGPDGRFLVGKVPNAAANKSVEVVLNRH